MTKGRDTNVSLYIISSTMRLPVHGYMLTGDLSLSAAFLGNDLQILQNVEMSRLLWNLDTELFLPWWRKLRLFDQLQRGSQGKR